ncbi:MAG: hypothetical protein WBN66_11925, partial [Smithella sp.]
CRHCPGRNSGHPSAGLFRRKLEGQCLACFCPFGRMLMLITKQTDASSHKKDIISGIDIKVPKATNP